MADLKISALTASTTPLAGTEVLPIVQSGATVKVTVSDLTAGRAISATQLTLTTGNLIVASGQGIDFSATPNTGTSELFADYEEGTWIPTVTSSIGTITTVGTTTGNYTKIGNTVYVTFALNITTNGTGLGYINMSLPFTCPLNTNVGSGRELNVTGSQLQIQSPLNGTNARIRNYNDTYPASSGALMVGSLTYTV
jgi:hypothetical protein